MTKFKLFRKKDKEKVRKALIVALAILLSIFYFWFLIQKHGNT